MSGKIYQNIQAATSGSACPVRRQVADELQATGRRARAAGPCRRGAQSGTPVEAPGVGGDGLQEAAGPSAGSRSTGRSRAETNLSSAPRDGDHPGSRRGRGINAGWRWRRTARSPEPGHAASARLQRLGRAAPPQRQVVHSTRTARPARAGPRTAGAGDLVAVQLDHAQGGARQQRHEGALARELLPARATHKRACWPEPRAKRASFDEPALLPLHPTSRSSARVVGAGRKRGAPLVAIEPRARIRRFAGGRQPLERLAMRDSRREHRRHPRFLSIGSPHCKAGCNA